MAYSAKLITIINELVGQAKEEKLELADLAPLISDGWNQYNDHPVFGPDGTSAPDENGLIRIKVLEDLQAQFKAQGKDRAVVFLDGCHLVACVPTMAKVEVGSRAWATVKTWCGNARWMNAMNLVGGERVYQLVDNTDPIGPKFVRGPQIKGATAVGDNFTTIQAVVAELERIANLFS